MSAKALQLWSLVKGPQFGTNSRFPFVPKKDVINTFKFGDNQAVTIEDTVSLATSVKNRQFPLLRYPLLISLVFIKSTCVLPHTFSGYCWNMSATVTSTVAFRILLSLTKSSVMSSTWCKENPFNLNKRTFLNKILLKGEAELLHICHSLAQIN